MIINIAAVAFPATIMLFADRFERTVHVRASRAVIGVVAFVAFCMAVAIVSVATHGPRTSMLRLEAIAH